jgi:hypothetical protein
MTGCTCAIVLTPNARGRPVNRGDGTSLPCRPSNTPEPRPARREWAVARWGGALPMVQAQTARASTVGVLRQLSISVIAL